MRCIPLVLAACLFAATTVLAAPAHRVCLAYSHAGGHTIFYDITTDSSITHLKRYDMSTNPPTYLGVSDYGALALPNPAGSNWDVGVAFAAAMQTRNVWVYPSASQTSAAHWDVLGADGDRWRFATTINGAPTEVTFATQNCAGFNGGGSPPAQQTPQPPAPVPTPPPAPQPTPASGAHHVCLAYSHPGGHVIFYDITTDSSITHLKRYDMSTNPPTYLGVNDYAALALPNPAGSYWGAGVAFAATMQTRFAWVYTQPTGAAHWDLLGADGDRWRFDVVINGAAVVVTFATQNCAGFNGGGSPPAQQTPQPPAPVPTPPPAPQPTPASGAHRVCTAYSHPGGHTIYYDITTDSSITHMKRFDLSTNPPTYLGVSDYGALALPNPAGSNWNIGIAFAMAMQARSIWVYTQATSAAHWDVLGADGDRWRFATTINGAPAEVTFATQNCLNL